MQVTIGGAECEILTTTDDNIQCLSPAESEIELGLPGILIFSIIVLASRFSGRLFNQNKSIKKFKNFSKNCNQKNVQIGNLMQFRLFPI